MPKPSYFIVILSIAIGLLNYSRVYAQESVKSDTLKVKTDSLKAGQSKSNYNELRKTGGSQSVSSDLASDNEKKSTWIKNSAPFKLDGYYNFKRKLNEKAGIAIGFDYMFLNQFASFSFSDKQAASGIFRFFGTWESARRNKNSHGSLYFKIENRHNWGSGVTPRNLGYEAGAAMSTASFKEFGWGFTNLYWKHIFDEEKVAIVAGIMDPGDWVDLFPQLNAFKYFLNEAYFNNPTMAIPNQGMGIVMHAQDLIGNLYVSGGIHDANGDPTQWLFKNIDSFFTTKEFLYWAELGWDFTDNVMNGQTAHIMYWQQDPRETANTQRSWGLNFSVAKDLYGGRYTAFVRGGVAEGNAPLMKDIILAGATVKLVKYDVLGFGVNYGTPNVEGARRQFGTEVFYSIQLTDHLNITPDVQLTFNPSFNDQRDVVGIYSVFRVRYAL